ncbi:MAG: 6-phosphogluconolactonase [Acidimicrobiia bacterium]|nr:6-phosphogluconolactonase [Acidimicrobiia bacterium]NNF63875.1 6-phosphogluconolactonase [Acidimicrobiia bacterium]
MAIHEFETPDDLAAGAAEFLRDRLRTSTDRTSLGLAGGSTPTQTYRRLRDLDVDWQSVDLWLTDERFVPVDHPDSNARMAWDELASPVAAHLHAPDVALGDPATVALRYAEDLERLLRSSHGRIEPDVVLLGMGPDGHTASLFPGTDALQATDPYAAVFVPKLDAWRLTATLPLLRAARTVVFLVAGHGKAAMLSSVLQTDEPHPVSLVASGHRDVHWFVDTAAASELGGAA